MSDSSTRPGREGSEFKVHAGGAGEAIFLHTHCGQHTTPAIGIIMQNRNFRRWQAN